MSMTTSNHIIFVTSVLYCNTKYKITALIILYINVPPSYSYYIHRVTQVTHTQGHTYTGSHRDTHTQGSHIHIGRSCKRRNELKLVSNRYLLQKGIKK